MVVISCALVYVLAEGITQIGGMEPESAKMCLFMMGWIVVKPIVWVLAFIPGYGMRAAGDVKFSMILSCISMWVFRVSLCVFLCSVMGFWTDRCMDRNVYGLDGAGDRVYVPFPQQKVAGTSGDSLSN